MKLAIYTPTHDFSHLLEAYDSIEASRTIVPEAVECIWCLLVNGNARVPSLPDPIARSVIGGVTHVRQVDDKTGNIGSLKRQACEMALALGATALVELDHDDALGPNCLRRLASEFAAGADFVASDTATQQRYRADYGWQAESQVVEGSRLWVNRTPEICSRSLAEIFYAPNHVRAWTREMYERVGGYDAALPVADDHDLLCRTYCAGADMRLLHEPLYIQRMGAEQTQSKRNQEIQIAQAAVGRKHLYALAQEEARRRGLPCFDLGGAHNCPSGYEAIDMPGTGATHELDVTQGLPFADDSVGILRAHDFLEHLPADKRVGAMNEFWRVLAPGGWLLTSTPSTDGRGAWQDPTHLSGWNSNSFWYYSNAELAQFVPAINCRFQTVRVENHHPTAWHKLHEIVYCEAALWCLKGQPTMGPVLI